MIWLRFSANLRVVSATAVLISASRSESLWAHCSLARCDMRSCDMRTATDAPAGGGAAAAGVAVQLGMSKGGTEIAAKAISTHLELNPKWAAFKNDGAARTAKYQAALEGGHDVLVLISEVWGGFSPEAMRFLGELSQARNDGIDIERASATWSTSSFTSYHGQLLSLAVQWGVAIEIERAIKKSARFC